MLIKKGLDGWQAIGSIIVRPIFLGLFGEAKAQGGDLGGVLETVDEGIRIARLHDELLSRLYLARIKGELLHKCGRVGEAETLLRETAEWCLKLGARSYALAAAVALANVQSDTGSGCDGRESVQRILGMYMEGFENSFIRRALEAVNA